MKRILTLTAIVTLMFTTSNAQHPVVWDVLQSVIVTGDGVEKIDGSFWGGTALSRNLLPAGSNGYVEVTVSDINRTRMIGFTSASTLVDYQGLDYAIATAASLNIKVFENGVEKGIFGTYEDGDKFALEKNGNTILYKRNGQTFHTAPITNPKNLKIGVDLYHDNTRWVNITTSFKAVDVNQMWDFISGSTLHDDIFRYGRVAIGTESLPSIPDGYKLSVEGRIIAEGVKVQLKNKWPTTSSKKTIYSCRYQN